MEIRSSNIDFRNIEHQFVSRLVDLGEPSSEGTQGGLRAQGSEIRTAIPDSRVSEFSEEVRFEGRVPLPSVD